MSTTNTTNTRRGGEAVPGVSLCAPGGRRGRWVGSWRLVLLALSLGLSAACVTSRAETIRERPALDVPIPPPREITPLPAPQPPPPAPVEDLPGSSVNTPARPRPQREPQAVPSKPEQKLEEKPVEPPSVPPPPVPQLRIPETSNTAQSEAQIRSIVERTKAILDKIDYGAQSDARKKQYDDAKKFATGADEALKENNLVYAKDLADKAERLAKELQGR